MIPHNIQQKLEERLQNRLNPDDKVHSLLGQIEGHTRGAEALWQILMETVGPFDPGEGYVDAMQTHCFTGADLHTYELGFDSGARYQFNILKPKMMAMEAEIQRLRAEIEDHALQARADEARREWVEDERG